MKNNEHQEDSEVINPNSGIEECIDNYKSMKGLYESFACKIKSLLEEISGDDLKFHTVTCRTKNEESLREKLKRKVQDSQASYSMEYITDLAACRIIFYTEADVSRFKFRLRNEFKIISSKLKYDEEDYNASHHIVKLNNDRSNLTEYKKFENLKCEIQITTVLHHAWSELAHDIIYKPEKSISEFDRDSFDSIKRRFSNVMKDHIIEAQRDLDFIAGQIEKIKEGKEIFSIDFMNSIVRSRSNNEIYQKLELLLEHVEKFGDKTPKDTDIIEMINKILVMSKRMAMESIENPHKYSYEHDYADVAIMCLEILYNLRFVFPKDLFEILGCLYVEDDSRIGRQSLVLAERMSQYTFYPEKNIILYNLQLIILDEIEEWDEHILLERLNLIIKIFTELLSYSFEGVSSKDYETPTIHSGALPANDTLKNIRKRVIILIKKIYSILNDIHDKQKILRTLSKAMHTPHRGSCTQELKKIISEDTNSVIDYYCSIINDADNEIVHAIEDILYYSKNHFVETPPGLQKLESIISKNKEHAIYKVLVGFDYHYSEESNTEESNKEREKIINGYIKNITQSNIHVWQKRILSIIRNHKASDDSGQFHNFRIFLRKFAENNPEFAGRLISEYEQELEHFLVNLVEGIWKSNQKENAYNILEDWIDNGEHLSICACILISTHEIDKRLLDKIYAKSKHENDMDAIIYIASYIACNFESTQIGKDMFINCIGILCKHGIYYRGGHLWSLRTAIFENFNSEDWKALLEIFTDLPEISWHVEKILLIAAKNDLRLLMDFFYKRIKFKTDNKNIEYTAIPFEFHLLNNAFNGKSSIVIEVLEKWSKEKDSSFRLSCGRLLKLIFPEFNEELEKFLIKTLNLGDEDSANMVLHVLNSYKGEVFLHEVCKEFIKKYPEHDKYKEDICYVLSRFGVVSGEYGFMNAYEGKKKDIQEWKKDKNQIILDFVQEYEDFLSRKIVFEEKRADEDIAMMSRRLED